MTLCVGVYLEFMSNREKNNTPDERKCPACGRTITGRANKIYCDDNCRNNYYYKLYGNQHLLVRNVNVVLLRNRLALKSLNPYGRKTFPKQALVDKDFDFDYFTGIRKTKKGKVYYVVYDYAYAVNENDTVDIVTFKPQSLIRRMPTADFLEESCLSPQIAPSDGQCE